MAQTPYARGDHGRSNQNFLYCNIRPRFRANTPLAPKLNTLYNCSKNEEAV